MVGHFVSTKEKSLWIPHVKIVCCDVALKQKKYLKKIKKWLICNPKTGLCDSFMTIFSAVATSWKRRTEASGGRRSRTMKDWKKRSEWTEETILNTQNIRQAGETVIMQTYKRIFWNTLCSCFLWFYFRFVKKIKIIISWNMISSARNSEKYDKFVNGCTC